nr:MAG TPA: hypothetical protein [Caudoviricetes sp.]DAT24131.1 MAG TPA: hypothetical protein [Caudoviricetes sp.]
MRRRFLFFRELEGLTRRAWGTIYTPPPPVFNENARRVYY